MLFNLKEKKRSILYVLLTSYSLVFMIPLIISSVIYFETDKTIKSEVNHSNALILSYIKDRMDNMLDDLKSLSVDIMFNPRFQEMTNPIYTKANPATAIDFYNAVKELQAYSISNEFIQEIYVYYKNMDFVLSPAITGDSKSVYSFFYPNGEFPYENWLETINGIYKGDYLPFFRMLKDNKKQNSIVYLRSFPVSSNSAFSANIMIMLSEEVFLQGIEDIEATDYSKILVINQDQNIVMPSSGIDMFEELNWDKILSNDDLLFEKIRGEKVVITSEESTVTGWKYVSVMPVKVFLKKINFVRMLAFAGVFLGSLLGAIAIYYLVKKNYNPIVELINVFRGERSISDKYVNEYDFLRESIQKTLEEKKEISSRLEQQQDILRNNFLVRLLKGEENSRGVYESLTYYDISFVTDYFAVVLFYIDDFEKFFAEDENIDSTEKYKTVQFIIRNVSEELMEKKCRVIMIEMGAMMIVLANLPDNADNSLKDIMDAAATAQRFIRDNFNIYFTAAVSNIHTGLMLVPKAYEEAIKAMEYRLVMGINRNICFEEINYSTDNYDYSLDKEMQLINCINAGNAEGAGLILDEMFKKLLSKQTHTVIYIKFMLLDIASSVIKIINEISDASGEEYKKYLGELISLLQNDNINHIMEKIKEITMGLCKYIKTKISEKSNAGQRAKEVIAFIENNYSNPDLSLAMISEYFGLHPVYISKVFKEQEGIGMLEYINKFRIKKAKELISKGDLKLLEVAGAIGCTNTRTFNRIFKKSEGITPSEFAQLIKDD